MAFASGSVAVMEKAEARFSLFVKVALDSLNVGAEFSKTSVTEIAKTFSMLALCSSVALTRMCSAVALVS